MFEEYLAIDWSGAGRDNARAPGLALATADGIVAPPRYRSWSRVEVEDYLLSRLTSERPRTMVAIDAALSYPFGFERATFGVSTWRAMVDAIGSLAGHHATAREIAHVINRRFDNGGPFRFDDSRNDRRFYVCHDVAYFRAVELLMPQCLSAFYLGSGASVGFHTITFLSMLSRLLMRRDEGELAFHVWPFEGVNPPDDIHVIAECYPALYPPSERRGRNGHEDDALRAVDWLRDWEGRHRLDVPEVGVGRRAGVSWDEQIALEGWVLGV